MFFIKKALTPFFIPPGIFIVLLFASGIWLFFRKDKKAAIINLSIAFLMWLFSISPVSNAILHNLNSDIEPPRKLNGDVVIILVGGTGNEMISRIFTAFEVHKQLNVPLIISGGRSVFDYKRRLMELGIPSNMILIENKSKDTFENAKFTKEIIVNKGFRKPILVTSPHHFRRSVFSFEKANLKVIPYPAGARSIHDIKYQWTDYLPGDFRTTYLAVREYLGLAFYKCVY